ncbi:hypothetical protein EMPS_07413 [Entomortierella parvispora]|uniref:C2H2-type domain-containing protein n=1 Tax=Entomortierella parvispora TaxID=205924 RepID=A0A9P3LYN7_9FUNG|nr:hypothetical protein EMPS_07413 [Entomortierella parvispora]
MSTQEHTSPPPPPHQEDQPAPSNSITPTARPEPRDTVSTMQPTTDPVVVKQEGNGPHHSTATVPEDSDMESAVQDPEEEHDADGENDEADEDDENNADGEEDEEGEEGEDDEDDEDEDEDEENETGIERGAVIIPKLAEGDEGDLTLSSDDDEEEEPQPNDDEYSNLPEETICRWKDCGKVLPTLAALVIHLSDEHIGWKKASYTCEWQGCSRRPIAQTTRFALISHMRSHTKHKPYDCPVPECDKSFSRSDAMAKHLKCQHGDVPERFTGRKSRGRYTMKDPSASSTLLRTSSGKKRRHDSRSDAEANSSSWSKHYNPAKLRKLGSDLRHNGIGSDMSFLERLHHHTGRDRHHYLPSFSRQKHGHDLEDDDTAGTEEERYRRVLHENGNEAEDDDADDSDFAIDNGQTPRERYGILKAKFEYIYNERDSLESEYEDMKRKLGRLRTERELLLDALLESQEEFQDPALMALEDSE